jgi:hypothetical protein
MDYKSLIAIVSGSRKILRGSTRVRSVSRPMIQRRIESIGLQWNAAGMDDVGIRRRRDDDREARSDRRPNTIENRRAVPLLHAKELAVAACAICCAIVDLVVSILVLSGR